MWIEDVDVKLQAITGQLRYSCKLTCKFFFFSLTSDDESIENVLQSMSSTLLFLSMPVQSNRTPTTPLALSSVLELSMSAGRRSSCRSGTPPAKSDSGTITTPVQPHPPGAFPQHFSAGTNPWFLRQQFRHTQLLQRSRRSTAGLWHYQVNQ